MGCSSAFFAKQNLGEDFRVAVIEKDPTYSRSSTPLSVGSVRQQFSIAENIQMSMFGAEFIKNLPAHLATEDDPQPDVQFHEGGYLFLASPGAGEATLQENYELQRSLGAKVQSYDAEGLAAKFPWMNASDVSMGVLGIANEGWFDPWSLLAAFRSKAKSLGVEFINDEVVGTEKDNNKINAVTLASGERLECGTVLNATGPWAGIFSEGVLGIEPFPVEARKRYVYCFHCPEGPDLCPLLVDPTGVYVRSEGAGRKHFICGQSPPEELDPAIENPCEESLEADHDFFNEAIWPVIASRVPAFEGIKVTSSWAGYYEYNTFDQNGIIGLHPDISNLLFANGFSGHGIQQAPAVGRAIAELVEHGKYITIDLDAFAYERILSDRPMREKNVV